MSKTIVLQRRILYDKIRVMSNEYRFRILELTQTEHFTVTNLSKTLKLSYTKCADYVRLLEKAGLVKKTRDGKEVLVRSLVTLKTNQLVIE